MSTPNINQITSQFARMSDQQIQQYAAMHKNDPYTMSLALSEMNRRKETRSAQMGQQQQQPKVVDQAIAEMSQGLPEDSGIAQLPTGPMQYADGGIVAFGSGGDVQRFNGTANSFVNAATQGVSLIDQIQNQGVNALRPLVEQIRQAEQQYVAAARSGDPAAIGGYSKTLGDLKAQLNNSVQSQFGNAAPKVMSQLNAPAVPTAPTVATVAPSANTNVSAAPVNTTAVPPVAAPNAATTGTETKGPGTNTSLSAAPRFFAAPAPVFDVNAEYEKARKTSSNVDPAAKERAELAKQLVDNPTQALKDRQTELAKEGDVYKGREERLSTKEKSLEKMDEQNKAFSFINAGLAMMQSRGQGLSGIAEGAMVGTKQYGAGIEKLRAAQERLDETREKMEDLRLNRSDMNARDIRQLNKDINTGQQKASELGINALMAIDSSSKEEAAAKFKVMAQMDITQRQERGLNTRAAMPSPQIQMITKLGDGDFSRGYEIYTQEALIPRLYESYIKQSGDILKPEFKGKYPTFDMYLAGMGGGKGNGIIDVSNPPAESVRPRN